MKIMKINARTTLAAMIITATFIGVHAIAFAQDSSARNVDQYTCKDIMREGDDSRTSDIAFLHGFLLGKSGSSAFDPDAMAKQTDSFIDYCLDHPNEKAMTAMIKFK
jgi:HdeA/HdeB family